jgi:2-polyprenyl-3-methyl-5-hydroxy-6-metoxy-1,4-benzoquinol methylase
MPPDSKKILDVGCAAGLLGERFKKENPDREIWGIDMNEKYIEVAKNRLDRAILDDVSNLKFPLKEKYFDTIIFADILEHLKDPRGVLKEYKKFLKEGGVIIVSIPNVRHITVILNLLIGHWNYQDSGILDKTHLRFFTKKSAIEMIEGAGYKIKTVQCNFSDHKFIALIAKLLSLFIFRNFFCFQYHILAINEARK